MKINYNSFIYRKPILGIFLVNILGACSLLGLILGIGEAYRDIELGKNPISVEGKIVNTKYSLAIINTATIEFIYEKSQYRFDYRYLVFTDFLFEGDPVEVIVNPSKPISYGLKFRPMARLPFILFICGFGIFGFVLFSIIGTRRIYLYKQGIKSPPFIW